jgi:hypothetical protein
MGNAPRERDKTAATKLPRPRAVSAIIDLSAFY